MCEASPSHAVRVPRSGAGGGAGGVRERDVGVGGVFTSETHDGTCTEKDEQKG